MFQDTISCVILFLMEKETGKIFLRETRTYTAAVVEGIFPHITAKKGFSSRDKADGKGRYDLLPWGAIHALAQHCERGAIHYGERNVDRGIPQHSLIDSGIRHLSLYIQGDAEAHHLVAALWNIAWAVEQEIKRLEMVDLPERGEHSGIAF